MQAEAVRVLREFTEQAYLYQIKMDYEAEQEQKKQNNFLESNPDRED
jgi:hypothetical protein